MDEQSSKPPISHTVQTNHNTSLNRKGNKKRKIICRRSTRPGDRKYERIQSPDKRPKTKQVWNTSAANSFGRFMNGLKRGISGTGKMKLIHKYEVPTGRTLTYARFVCDYRPQKEEKHRTRITVGGDRINYPGNVTTRGADMTTIKLLLNSVVSTPDARFITTDIKNFYLNT